MEWLGDFGADETSIGGPFANRYDLLGFVGSGGMGAVYRVRDRELDEVVALKVLRSELMVDPDAVAHFRREVKLARRVTHKNVTRTFDIGELDGTPFFTMEFVEGASLGDMLDAERVLTPEHAARIAMAVAHGLDAAHEAGVVHGDLKPTNVLLARDGRILVSDFGTARSREVDKHRVLSVAGTPEYMAPEQIETPESVDGRADLYALGIVLYEMLTGELPWSATTTLGMMTQRLVVPAPDPRKRRPDLPARLSELVLTMLARDREKRIPTAAALAAALEPFARGGTISFAERIVPGASSVAVLPFEHTGSPDDAYLALGLTDVVIERLSRVSALNVRPMPRLSIAQGARDAVTLGRDFGVDAVLESWVETSAEGLEVKARLVATTSGFVLWAERVKGERREALKIGEQVAERVGGVLSGASPKKREETRDPEALDLYLRGRHAYHRFWRQAEAVELLERALSRAPDDAHVLASLALALLRETGQKLDTARERQRALHCAERALTLAPSLSDAHVAMGALLLRHGETVEAARSVRTALDLGPGNVDALEEASRILLETRSLEHGIARAELAMRVEPALKGTLPFQIVRAHALLGEWREVERFFVKKPSETGPRASYWLARARLASWRDDLAAQATVVAELENDSIATKNEVLPFVRLLLEPELSRESRRIMTEKARQPQSSPRQRAFFCQIAVEAFGRRGELDQAFAMLEAADRDGLFDIAWLDGCPIIAKLRDRPAFAVIEHGVAHRADQAMYVLLGVDPSEGPPTHRWRA